MLQIGPTAVTDTEYRCPHSSSPSSQWVPLVSQVTLWSGAVAATWYDKAPSLWYQVTVETRMSQSSSASMFLGSQGAEVGQESELPMNKIYEKISSKGIYKILELELTLLIDVYHPSNIFLFSFTVSFSLCLL